MLIQTQLEYILTLERLVAMGDMLNAELDCPEYPVKEIVLSGLRLLENILLIQVQLYEERNPETVAPNEKRIQ